MALSALKIQVLWKSWKGSRSKSAGTRTSLPVTLALSPSSNQCSRKGVRRTLSWRPARSPSRRWLSITQLGHATNPLFSSAVTVITIKGQLLYAALGLRLLATRHWLSMLMDHTKVARRLGVKRFQRKYVPLITAPWWKVLIQILKEEQYEI